MLKLCLLLFAVLGVYSQSPFPISTISAYSWTGTTAGATTFLPPNTLVAAGCGAGTTQRSYQVFNASFTTAGVRQVSLLAESAFKASVVVYYYSGAFNPASPCTSYVRALINANSPSKGSLSLDDYIYFTANTVYFFVVSTTAATNNVNGVFGLQIQTSTQTGTTVGSGNNWTPALKNANCTLSTVTQAFSLFTYQPQTSGTQNYDLLAIFEVGDAGTIPNDWTTFMSVYSGTFTAANIASGSCNSTWGSSLYTSATEGDRSAVALSIALTGFATYTVVISASTPGNWAFQAIPTRIRTVTPNGYTQPTQQSTNTSCTASSNTNAAYLALSATAVGFYTLVETDTIPTYLGQFLGFDTYAFAYNGAYTPSTTACPNAGSSLVSQADTGNAGPLVIPTTQDKVYTAVITTAAGGPLAPNTTNGQSAAALVYIFGPLTKSAVPTTTTTTGTTTLTSTTTTSGNLTTTSDSAAIAASMLFVAAGALLHLLL